MQLHAQKWEEAHWDDASMQERKGRGSNSVYVYVQHCKNHLWKEVWPGMLVDAEARRYWHVVTKLGLEVFDGGGGGMKTV